MVDFVPQVALEEARETFCRAASVHDSKEYEDWQRLHSALVAELKRYGEVTDWDGGDFYHGGDWFTSLSDGFALRTVEPLKKMSVAALQSVLAQHSPHASVSIGGEMCTPLDGLEFFIHPRATLAAWRDKSRDDCRAHLLSLGLRDR